MSGYQYQCEDAIEPISDTFGEQATNAVLYNVVNGCAVTPSASDLTVATAIGVITAFSATAAVSASASAWTLIPDATLPRWGWLAYGLTGTPALVQGDPASPPTVPELGDRVAAALYYIQAALTIAANATYRLDKRVPAPEPKHLHNYTSATQTVSVTNYANVVGVLPSSAATVSAFAFDAAVGGVYLATYYLPLTFTSTGGAKFQFTGPASPAAVSISGAYGSANATGGGVVVVRPIVPVAALSSDVNSLVSAAHNVSDVAYQNDVGGSFIRLQLMIINGTTAGAVALQIGQNTASGNTVIGIGATMDVVRLA